MSIKRIEDILGTPVEFSQNWEFSGVSSRTDAEKEDLAREALENKCKQWVDDRIREGKNIAYDHAQLIRVDNEGSETHQDWRGVRTHKCWGTGVGYLFVNMP